MKPHRWAGSGTGLGRRFECGGCGTTVFSFETPIVAEDGRVYRKPGGPSQWDRTEVVADCDAEKVREVMES